MIMRVWIRNIKGRSLVKVDLVDVVGFNKYYCKGTNYLVPLIMFIKTTEVFNLDERN